VGLRGVLWHSVCQEFLDAVLTCCTMHIFCFIIVKFVAVYFVGMLTI
jgi:hypothetical protein